MHWLLFIYKILFSSTCFEPQVLIFRRIQLYTCSIWYCHSLWEFLVACGYTAWVRTDWRGKVFGGCLKRNRNFNTAYGKVPHWTVFYATSSRGALASPPQILILSFHFFLFRSRSVKNWPYQNSGLNFYILDHDHMTNFIFRRPVLFIFNSSFNMEVFFVLNIRTVVNWTQFHASEKNDNRELEALNFALKWVDTALQRKLAISTSPSPIWWISS